MEEHFKNLIDRNQFTFGLIIALIFSSVIYKEILFNNNLLAFPDLGTFPLRNTPSLNYLIYSWMPQGFGFYGSSLPYVMFIWAYVQAFGSVLGEHIWLLLYFIVGYASEYFLLSLTEMNSKLRVLFSLLYIFNPAFTGLFYEASINDTLTLYVLFPALIAVALKVYSNKINIPAILAFTALTSYAYFWNPQVVMWILPVILVGMVARFAKEQSFRAFVSVVISTIIFLLFFLIITGGLETFIQILLGRGNNVFIIAQSANPYDILNDLRDNFYGQFPLFYSYISLNWSAILIYFWVKFRKALNENEAILLAVSIIETVIVNFTWLTFRSNFIYLQLLLVKYFPLVGAYEPFFAVSISFSLLISATGIILSKLKPVKWRKKRSLNLKNFVLAMFVVWLLIIPLPYWRNNSVPSVVMMPSREPLFNKYYEVPKNLILLAEWAQKNTDTSSGYRYLFLPGAIATLGAFEALFPQNAPLDINSNFYNAFFYQFINSKNASLLAKYLSILGVEYIFIYKGPYLGDDSNVSYSGNIRLQPSGWTWALTYLPYGYWGKWYKLFTNSNDFLLVANTTGYAVFKNKLYVGVVYSLPKGNYTIFNGYYLQHGKTIPLTGPWLGFNSILGKSFSVSSNDNVTKVFATNPYVNYGNILLQVNLKPRTYYILSYNVTGINVNNANIYIRFYSGVDGTGKILYTLGSPPVSGNINQYHVVWLFETPSNFSSAYLFPTVLKSNNNYSYVNFTIYPLIQLKPMTLHKVNYTFLSPTEIKIQGINSSYLIFVSNYNPGWRLYVNNICLNSSNFNTGFLNVTLFNISGSIHTAVLYFYPQTQYYFFLIVRMIMFVFISILAIIFAVHATLEKLFKYKLTG
ncbi:MAG: hypothetical protein ACP5U0_08650 [Caldisphaera sp.]